MHGAGLDVFDSTVHKTNLWLKEIMDALGWDDRHKAYQALRATLQAVRDRLTIDEIAHLGAQLGSVPGPHSAPCARARYQRWRTRRYPTHAPQGGERAVAPSHLTGLVQDHATFLGMLPCSLSLRERVRVRGFSPGPAGPLTPCPLPRGEGARLQGPCVWHNPDILRCLTGGL